MHQNSWCKCAVHLTCLFSLRKVNVQLLTYVKSSILFFHCHDSTEFYQHKYRSAFDFQEKLYMLKIFTKYSCSYGKCVLYLFNFVVVVVFSHSHHAVLAGGLTNGALHVNLWNCTSPTPPVILRDIFHIFDQHGTRRSKPGKEFHVPLQSVPTIISMNVAPII